MGISVEIDGQRDLGQVNNRVIIAKLNRPGSPEHQGAMENLAAIIANNAGALEALKRQQNKKQDEN